jgi:hypothetical protein
MHIDKIIQLDQARQRSHSTSQDDFCRYACRNHYNVPLSAAIDEKGKPDVLSISFLYVQEPSIHDLECLTCYPPAGGPSLVSQQQRLSR